MIPQNRRSFLKTGALLTAASILPSASRAAKHNSPPKLNLFSKHLQFLDYQEMAKVAKEIGFDGIDLTVRPRGHVLPEKVDTDLPRAAEAVRAEGLDLKMMTTAVDDASKPLDRLVLKTAASEGITHYRMNWYRYNKESPLPETLERCRQKIVALGELNKELGLTGCYQNHSGFLVGASIWEVWKILQGSLPSHMGAQYDIRHATVEGGRSWPNGYRLISPRIRSIAIKDFRWEGKGSSTKLFNTPLGEGMVDFKKYFRLLKTSNIEVPISMHYEYDLGGADKGKRELSISRDAVYEAMRKDIATFKRLWKEA
ncbi:TIM barrel protein [Pelagicoccus mobilis]|uniref:TIM barrel protein n=1 Tax=Pelagicoccus mobilis TaxID=415221 RepID=A0A934RYV1_9BACT|nr:TIM barrel protein [Pelagicoccus mobilis]MBK1879116.1 TIM barrel protein [Pelagicoccus mobilis]